MIIAINTHSLFPANSRGYKKTFIDCLKKLAIEHPEHTFIFISNTEIAIGETNNIKMVTVPAKANGPIRWKLWYDFYLLSIVKKTKADVLISAGYISLKITIPQVLLIPEITFLDHPKFYKRAHLDFYKKNFPLILNKATVILAPNTFLQQQLIDNYKTPVEKIIIVPSLLSGNYSTLNWQDASSIKEEYSEGKEYFLYVGEIAEKKNLIGLLKAFSKFKKMQKSNMHLLLSGNIADNYTSFADNLNNYKFKDDVAILENIPEENLKNLIAAAYAFIDVSVYMDNNIHAMKAVQSKVPVIISKTEAMERAFETAALYVNPENIDDIADKMMLIFKDEDRRNKLIIEAKQLKEYTIPNKTTQVLWDVIVAATKQ